MSGKRINLFHERMSQPQRGSPVCVAEGGVDAVALRMQKTGVRLCLSEIVIAAGISYYYKFKEFGPISSFSPLECATACLFLASKVCDETRKIRDILNCWKEADGASFDKELTKE